MSLSCFISLKVCTIYILSSILKKESKVKRLMNSHVDCVMTPLVLAFVDPPKIQTSKYPQSKTYKRYDVVKNSFLVEVIKSNLDKRA